MISYLVGEIGIRQIIDIGAGLPTAGNTHELAQAIAPDTRVVYVDHDPVVLVHARALLHAVPNTAVIGQDLHSPDAILADLELRTLIDFSQPVALLFLSVLHFIGEEADPAGLIARLHDPFPSTSHVAISHVTPDAVADVAQATEVFDQATERAYVRTGPEVAKLVVGLDLVEPGLVWTPDWRPEPGVPAPPSTREAYYRALVARKP